MSILCNGITPLHNRKRTALSTIHTSRLHDHQNSFCGSSSHEKPSAYLDATFRHLVRTSCFVPGLTHRNNIALITGNAPLKWTVKLRALSLEAFRRRRSWRSLDGYRSLVRHSAPNPINNSSVLSRITSRAPIGTTSDLQQYSNTNLIFEAHPMLWGASHALSVLLA